MSIRTERLGAVIQEDLGKMLQLDYQPAGSFVTVTNVEVTPDLMIAKIFVSIYAPGKDEDAIYQRIEDGNAEIRKALASKIRHQVRRIPELLFNKDESAEYAQHMEELFTEIREERESRDNNNDTQEE
jgi:ribosome-binding factor A